MKNNLKNLLAFMLAVVLLLSYSFAEEEGDVSLGDILQNDAQTASQEDLDALEGELKKQIEGNPVDDETKNNEQDDSTQLVLTFGGDVTIGGDVRNKSTSIYDKELKKQNNDVGFAFRNVKKIFEEDDMTLLNFEGTLTTAPINKEKRNNQFLFSAPLSYGELLPLNSVEAVSLENNHVMDHGEEGYNETMKTLSGYNVVYSNENKIGVYEVKGIRIAMLSYQTFNGRYPDLFKKVPQQVKEAKANYDLVIVSYHWGEEKDYWPNNNQQKLGKATIDAGADLVVGHHSHRINPIEEYNGKYIVYSLGNCSFAGNNKPSDMSTFLFQLRYKILDGKLTQNAFRIIQNTDYNYFTITPYTKEVNIQSVIKMLEKNGRHIDNPVSAYPTEW